MYLQSVQVEVTGLPKPKVKWFQGESHLSESARVSLEQAGAFSCLQVFRTLVLIE